MVKTVPFMLCIFYRKFSYKVVTVASGFPPSRSGLFFKGKGVSFPDPPNKRTAPFGSHCLVLNSSLWPGMKCLLIVLDCLDPGPSITVTKGMGFILRLVRPTSTAGVEWLSEPDGAGIMGGGRGMAGSGGGWTQEQHNGCV